jgi:hypothetical protein
MPDAGSCTRASVPNPAVCASATPQRTGVPFAWPSHAEPHLRATARPCTPPCCIAPRMRVCLRP